MGMAARGPIRAAGWAFPLCSSRDGGVLGRLRRGRSEGFVILVCLLLLAVRYGRSMINMAKSRYTRWPTTGHEHHGAAGHQAGWEGCVAGIAYSEFHHHLTGMLVLIIGLSELRQALAIPF